MNLWELPVSLTIAGTEYPIRTDYRAVLDILCCYRDPEYEQDEKCLICLKILFVDFDRLPPERYEEALMAAMAFIDHTGREAAPEKRPSPRLMDWEQDAPLIIPAVNRVLGKEIRALEYLHWWTFLDAFQETGDCLFSQVVNIRRKKAKGKKLEKYEQEFYRDSKALCDLKKRYTQEEKQEQERLMALFD